MHRIRLNWAARGGRGFLQQPRNPDTKFISKECRMEQATVLTWTPRKPAFPAFSGLFRTIPIGHHQDIACSALPVLTTGAAVISVNAEVPPRRTREFVLRVPATPGHGRKYSQRFANFCSRPPPEPLDSPTSGEVLLGGANPPISWAWGILLYSTVRCTRPRIGLGCTKIAWWCIAPSSLQLV
jgi:hypothetical protein